MRGVGYLRAGILLALALGAGGFALGPSYGLLMNPAFRWITLAGAGLLFLMSAALFWKPDRGGSSVLVFVGFFALLGWAGAQEGRVTPLLAPPSGSAALGREGYDTLAASRLFRSVEEEAADVPLGAVAMRGFVKRSPEMDAAGRFLLLEPLMACCLADAVAFGLRVQTSGALPEERDWVHVYGTLTPLDPPEPLPSLRVGAIFFVSVSRNHLLLADDVVSYRTLLESVVERIPADRCSVFRRALAESGLQAELEAGGPYTVFAPLDGAFRALSPAAREGFFSDGAALRAFVQDHVLRGAYDKASLHAHAEVECWSGRRLPIQSGDGRLLVGGARILFADQRARNGLVHFVNVRLQAR